MAVFSVAKTGQTIVNGGATVCNGESMTSHADSQRVPEFSAAAMSGFAWVTNLNTRYIYHGGAGGSGAWEH